MSKTLTTGPPAAPRSVGEQLDVDRRRFVFVVIAGAVACLMMGAIAYRSPPGGEAIAWLVLLMACIASVAHPFVGVYVTVALALIGDGATMPWWPYTKNLSGRESLMFVSDSIIINPLEILLGCVVLSFFLQRLEDPTWRFRRGNLFRPVATFTFFILFGIVHGIATGGDKRTAVFEFRGLLYIPIMYVLVTNLLTSRKHYERLLMVAMVAVCIQSVFALYYYNGLTAVEKEQLESLGQHSGAILMAMMFVYFLALFLLKASRRTTWAMFGMSIPVMYAFILAQRRAAFIALVVGIIVIMIVLFQRRRKTFWVFTPLAIIFGVGLVAATWNATGTAGLASQSVKSVIAPDSLDQADRSSSLYRDVENFDLHYTIESSPILGRGFGQQFLRPAPLPDISWVEFWEYIPHNSVLYIWIKTGFFGFVTFLYVFCRASQIGARSIMAVRRRQDMAILVAGTSFALMFLVFAYVDIAWDQRSTVFLGFALALATDYADQPARAVRRLPVDARHPGLVPL